MAERVLVVGGTRGTGAHVVRLLARDGVEVRVLARRSTDPGMLVDTSGAAVEVVTGDVARPGTLTAAMRDVDGVIYTAGVRSFFAPSASRAVTVDGVRNTVEAALASGFGGRIVFLSSIGADRPSLVRAAVDGVKGGGVTLKLEAERLLTGSGLDVVVVRAGVLLDRPAGRHPLHVAPGRLPLKAWYLVGRADVARVLVDSLMSGHPVHRLLDVLWASRLFRGSVSSGPP